MPFTEPFTFESAATVVIAHAVNGKHLRVRPKQPKQIDKNGGKGQFARWLADPQESGTQIRLKSTKTNKYLRVVKR